MSFKHTLLLCALLPLTACASTAAAKKTGVDIKKVAKCQTLTCVYTQKSAEKVDEKMLENGQKQYVYRMQKKQGSYLRSLGYGVAAIGTLGLSEVIATPAEGAIQNDQQFAVIADCNTNDGQCSRLVIVQPKKDPYIVYGHTDEEKAAISAAEAEKAAKKS